MLSTKSNQYSTTMSGQTLVISFWLCSLLPLNLENSLSKMKARQLLHVGNVLLQMKETSLPPQKPLKFPVELWKVLKYLDWKLNFNAHKLSETHFWSRKIESRLKLFSFGPSKLFPLSKKTMKLQLQRFFHLLMPVFFVFPFASQIPLTTSFQSMLVSWSPPSSAPQCLSEVVPRICRMGIQLVLFTRQLTRCSMYIYLRTCTPKTTQM